MLFEFVVFTGDRLSFGCLKSLLFGQRLSLRGGFGGGFGLDILFVVGEDIVGHFSVAFKFFGQGGQLLVGVIYKAFDGYQRSGGAI